MKYGDHPEFGHHIGGSDASGVVWKVGPGVTRWKVGDEVVVHCNQASYEDVEVHGLDPMAAPSQRIWGYETTWGSFAQFTKVQAQQLLPKPQALTWEEAASYGLVYFTAWRMLITRAKIVAGSKVLIWGGAGGLGVFAIQICKAAGAECVAVVSSEEKGELCMQLGAKGFIEPQGVPGHGPNLAAADRRRGEDPLQGLPRVRQGRQRHPRRCARRRLRARRAADVPHLGPRRQAVRQGRHLRRHDGLQPGLRRPLPVDEAEGDPRLALRQRLRVHEGQRADRERPGPPRALPDARLRRGRRGAPAHARQQALREDRDPRRRRPRRAWAARPRAPAPSTPK